ncbi:hypothetical protein BX616_001219 [Lobosporangium transversale]|uniref:holo-[acyl-carrier-protein] synthase n=1 Tax=Lobosporangium transversale TaxID=64571 RepID=A0A1Y2GP06_9FUNG|nr:hypothetical protein BCR41DRAFT_353319 [Lobosporangium transversale]KAF9904713.1 hypothetical protein BX616_001219 [Lobosporangium transversale]ORZ15995.1 hypothetical protein BCR41DRAFT_353319 [Lobosporangium transversale]|eukprot:XP_021881342.1 hypothetical protein BCR41DRAFT_353319 [Lobosporangium transversale]
MPLARWAFNIRQPLLLENIEPLVTSLTDDDNHGRIIVPVSNLLNYLPKVESDTIRQLHLEDDMRRALVARLMIHAFFTAHHHCQWEDLVFDDSESTRPVVLSPEYLKNVSFNISYHGDWVILVGETESTSGSPVLLGVDVMDFQEQVPGESFESFSSCFQDQFTEKEITFMAEASAEGTQPCTETQLKRFYRLWCLKESTIKALDVRPDFDLKTIEFVIHDEEETEKPILSTVIEVHEPKPEQLPEEGWAFEEALLDADHCYAIAAQSLMEKAILDGSEIRRFDWKELLKDAVPYPA